MRPERSRSRPTSLLLLLAPSQPTVRLLLLAAVLFAGQPAPAAADSSRPHRDAVSSIIAATMQLGAKNKNNTGGASEATYLATERTYLASVRTALALLGFGLVLSKIFVGSTISAR